MNVGIDSRHVRRANIRPAGGAAEVWISSDPDAVPALMTIYGDRDHRRVALAIWAAAERLAVIPVDELDQMHEDMADMAVQIAEGVSV